MADGALRQIYLLCWGTGLSLGEARGPRDIIGIDVQEVGLGVVSGPAVLRATVEAGEDDGFLVDGEGHELAIAAEGLELVDCPLVSGWSALGEHVLSEALAGEGDRLQRHHLRFRGLLSGRVAGREGARFHRKERLAGNAVKQVEPALLAGLRDGVDLLAVAVDGDQGRRGGEVAIPDVMLDGLEVPQALPGARVEGDEGIGEEVVAEAVGSVEVGGGRTGGNEHDAALGVDRHARPVVGGTGIGPAILGPSLIAELAGVGDGVEGPVEFASADVIGADIAGGGG